MAELPVVWTKGLGDISFAMFKPRGKMALRIQAFVTMSHREVLFFSLNFCLKSSGHFGLVCREREGGKLWACCESVWGGTCKAGKMTS